MIDTLFRGLFDGALSSVISASDFLACLGTAMVLGLVMALSYMFRTRYTKSFVVTLALLPAVVCVVIMLVNGNVGTGVAVAGAFSLVRFHWSAVCCPFLSCTFGTRHGIRTSGCEGCTTQELLRCL